MEDIRIKQVVEFVGKNLDRNISLQNLAQKYNLCYSYLSKLFKEEVGICFSKYLIQARIKKAKEFLRNNSMSIKQISYSIGYKYVPNFNHDFKRITGLSPSEYRNKWHKFIFKYINKLGIEIRKIANFTYKKTNKI